MSDGIEFVVLGDYGPFSEQGKSIGYQALVNGDSYFIDLGAPLFQQIGGENIGKTNGVIITHCHDDHKRWFTDVALYYMYAPSLRKRLKLITTDTVAKEVQTSAGPALYHSLDAQSKRLVDIAYEDYIDHVPIGPRARYRIAREPGVGDQGGWLVVDAHGNRVSPRLAKVVLSPKTNKPRMLFCDPASGEWVEPEAFYAFSATVFYEADARPLIADGYTIHIINAPVWHGLPNFGVVIEAGGEKLIFSSDTMHNLPLWQSLYQEKRTPQFDLSSQEFLDAGVLVGDINDYIERTWSEARYQDAIKAFDGAAVVHDVTGRYGVVHTEYHGLPETTLDPERTLLTHSPDRFTVVDWKLMRAGKRYRVADNRFVEVVPDGTRWPIDADVYHKRDGRFFAGYRHAAGRHFVYAKAGYQSVSDGECGDQGELLFRVNLFEDVTGQYVPCLADADQHYMARADGKVECVSRLAEGLRGRVVEDLRAQRHAIEPAELERLLRQDVLGKDPVQAELRELQRGLAAMRDRLELQAAQHQDDIQRAVAGAQAEILQARQTIAALRDELEKAQAAVEAQVNEARKQANAEVMQLRHGTAALREAMDLKDVHAANGEQEAVSFMQQELMQLRSTISVLRDQLDGMKK